MSSNYTQAEFKLELADISRAANGSDPNQIAAAATRASALLRAGGRVGSIVSGGNRIALQNALSRCRSELAGHMTPPDANAVNPQGDLDPATAGDEGKPDDGGVDSGSGN